MSDQEFEFEDVPAFNEHELSDTSTNSQPGKPGNKRKNWVFIQKYDSIEQALQALAEYDSYSYKRTHETVAGKKEEYRCSKTKVRGPQCDSAVQLLYHDEDMSVSLYKTRAEHTHDLILGEHSRLKFQ